MKFHLTHYKKIKLDKDISLRFFFTFEDRPSLNNKWVIKSHSTKEYSVIDERTALLIAKSHNKTLDDYKEIMGRYVNYEDCKPYRKVVISKGKSNDKAKFKYEGLRTVVDVSHLTKENEDGKADR